jgi:DNA-directed RNA polymerase subunit RPC12/RpoP
MVETLFALRCANCGIGYLGATVERLLLASSGARCPSCRSPLIEERYAPRGRVRAASPRSSDSVSSVAWTTPEAPRATTGPPPQHPAEGP